MSEETTKPITAGSNEWLSDMELTARGFPTAEIGAAIRRGELAGQLFPLGYTVKAGDLADWLASRKSNSGKTTATVAGATVTFPSGRTPRKAEAGFVPAPAAAESSRPTVQGPAAAFLAEVDRLEAGGMSRSQAAKAVVRQRPDLQAAAIRDANECRPRAPAGVSNRKP